MKQHTNWLGIFEDITCPNANNFKQKNVNFLWETDFRETQ